jgi:acetyltransferase-like isoleucine patch superfamily enzyme
LVTSDVLPDTIVAGNHAGIIRRRKEEGEKKQSHVNEKA